MLQTEPPPLLVSVVSDLPKVPGGAVAALAALAAEPLGEAQLPPPASPGLLEALGTPHCDADQSALQQPDRANGWAALVAPPAVLFGSAALDEGQQPADQVWDELIAAGAVPLDGPPHDFCLDEASETLPSPGLPPSRPTLVSRLPLDWGLAEDCASIDTALRYLAEFDEVLAARTGWSDDQWMAELESVLRSGDSFRAGAYTAHVGSWLHYFKAAGLLQHPGVSLILPCLQQGYELCFAPVAEQTAHPRYLLRIERARASLARVLGKGQVDSFLAGNCPKPVVFPNHRSVVDHADFVRSELQEFARLGAIQVYDSLVHGEGVVVHPLSVAVTSKKRLCIDANYTNIFEPYRPVQFEMLSHTLSVLLPGDFTVAGDQKKGYLHMQLHPASRRFLGIRFDGVTYVFAAVPFGLGSAVWAFSSVMRAAYLPLRMAGWRMTFMLDDWLSGWRQRVACWLGSLIYVRIVCSLGFHLGLAKCQLTPHQVTLYQGMLIDSGQGTVVIPAAKLQAFDLQLSVLLATELVTRRMLAKLAGLVASFFPGVWLGPLYMHAVFKMIAQHETGSDWDVPFTLSEEERAHLRWLRSYIPAHNGKRFWHRAPSVVLVTDASVSGAGGAAVSAANPLVRVTLQGQLPLNTLLQSSGCREVGGLVTLLQTLLHQPDWRRQLQHGCLKVITDSQVAAADISAMKGKGAVFSQVLDLYELAAANDIEILVEWRPREDPMLQWADQQSKQIDAGDWGVPRYYYEGVLLDFGCPRPVFDWFACLHNAKERAFCSRVLSPGATFVGAFDHPWSLPAGQLCYICPPQMLIPRVLSKIMSERVSCVLVLPAWYAIWHGLLQLLPICKQCSIPGHCIEWGPRAPPPRQRCEALRAGLRAYLVIYP